jgi:hypothetical protein
MAKFELRFFDISDEKLFTRVGEFSGEICIGITDEEQKKEMSIYLDKSTAIKFAKTLRTEINKITESEVNNG